MDIVSLQDLKLKMIATLYHVSSFTFKWSAARIPSPYRLVSSVDSSRNGDHHIDKRLLLLRKD